MKHEYSTLALILFIGVITIASIGTSIVSEDIDETCSTDNSILKRLSGTWKCSKTAFGELVISSDTTIDIATFNTYYEITNMTIQHAQGITTNNNSYFEIDKEGYYKISVTTSFSGGGNTEYEIELFVNGGANPHCELHRKMGTGGDVGSASFSCIDYFYINDIVDIRVSDNTNPSQDIMIHTLNFNIMEVQ